MPSLKKQIDELLDDWYGPERGADEKIARNPQFHPFSKVLDQYIRSIVSEGVCILNRIADEWPAIIGEANAKLCRPVFYRDGELKVEISHPAYRLALDTKKMKTAILERIAAMEIPCRSIIFVPAGQVQPRKVSKT